MHPKSKQRWATGASPKSSLQLHSNRRRAPAHLRLQDNRRRTYLAVCLTLRIEKAKQRRHGHRPDTRASCHIHHESRRLAHAWMKNMKDMMRRGICMSEEGRRGVPGARIFWATGSSSRMVRTTIRRPEGGGAGPAAPSCHESDRLKPGCPISPWIWLP
jgi:hypothetical protein